MKNLNELREENLIITNRESDLNKNREKKLCLKMEKKIEKAIMNGLEKKQNWVEITKLDSELISENSLRQQKYSFLSIGSSYYICIDGEDIYKYKDEIRNEYLKPVKDTKTAFKDCVIDCPLLFIVFSLLFYFTTKILISGSLNCNNIMNFTRALLLIGAEISLLFSIGVSIKFIIQILYYWVKKDSKYVKKIESEWISATCKNKEDIQNEYLEHLNERESEVRVNRIIYSIIAIMSSVAITSTIYSIMCIIKFFYQFH